MVCGSIYLCSFKFHICIYTHLLWLTVASLQSSPNTMRMLKTVFPIIFVQLHHCCCTITQTEIGPNERKNTTQMMGGRGKWVAVWENGCRLSASVFYTEQRIAAVFFILTTIKYWFCSNFNMLYMNVSTHSLFTV